MSERNLAKFCPGCGYPIVMMMLNQTLNKHNLKNQASLGLDIGCSLLGLNSLPINTFQTHHGRVVPTIVGFKRAKKDSTSLALLGDGGAYAIGLQSLIWSAKRDEPITVLVMNNSLYAMTGGQSAPTTLKGQKTTTHPLGSESEVFMGPELLKSIVQPGAYLARTAVNEPKKLMDYLEKAILTQQKGHFSLLEVLIFCPTNWKTAGKETLDYLDNLKKEFKVGEIQLCK